MSYLDEKKEKEFDEWLESIHIVNSEGEELEPVLTDDDSPDPEGDKG